MAKILLFNEEARQKLLTGINTLADAVATTLGPKGDNVAITKKWGIPNVTHDGVTVAREIELQDQFENTGAQLLREAASKTNDIAGDGTTTATVVARAIIQEGYKAIQAGANPQLLKIGIEAATAKVLEQLSKNAKKIKTRAEYEQVATISAASKDLGKIIAEAISKAGEHGVVTIDESNSLDITIDHTEGMEFEKTYISHYFITDDKQRAVVKNPLILITDQRIASQQDIVPFLDEALKVSKDLVVIADNVEAEALALLVVNKLKGNFQAVAVQAPAFGLRRRQILEDIATLTGATVISEDTGRTLSQVTVDDLGHADKVICTKDSTLIVNGKGNKRAIEARVNQVKNELELADNEFDNDQIRQRLAKMTGGVVVIKVGGATEPEINEKKYRIEDAVNATKAAIEEGIVPGGETALLKARRVLEDYKGNGDEAIGVKVVYEALKQPFIKLMTNAGITDGELIAQAMRADGNDGINVMTEKLTDLIKDGVIDPVKVSKTALQNAASVAAMILTTKVIIVDEPQKEEHA